MGADRKVDPPTVSIVMPVYNAAPFLARSIGSALGQTCSSLELICVDDRSDDGGADDLAAFAAADSRVRVLQLENHSGASAARNVGIDAADGAYLAFLDADDELPPRAVEALLGAAREHDCDLVMGTLDWRRSPQAPPLPDREGDVIVTRAAVSDYLQSLPGAHYCNLYRRDLIESHELRYPEQFSLGEDQVFQASAIARAKRVAVIPEVVYVYHHYQGSSATLKPMTLNSLLEEITHRRTIARMFLANDLPLAARRSVDSWSYTIQEYWWQIPEVLTLDEARQVFDACRSVLAEFSVTPGTDGTRPADREIMELVIAGKDAEAVALLGRLRP